MNQPKNIISYPFGTVFSGSEIKDWIRYHSTLDTQYSAYAIKLKKYLSIKDSDLYELTLGPDKDNRYQFKKLTPEKI